MPPADIWPQRYAPGDTPSTEPAARPEPTLDAPWPGSVAHSLQRLAAAFERIAEHLEQGAGHGR